MNTNAFALRHIGPRENDQKLMLQTVNADTIEQLISETVPAPIRLEKDLQLDEAMTEYEYSNHINNLSKLNKKLSNAHSFNTGSKKHNRLNVLNNILHPV